jgi:hypothetical protein
MTCLQPCRARAVEISVKQPRGVVIREGGGNDLPVFYELVEATSRRQNFTPYPQSYFEQMWRVFNEKGQAYLLLAEYQGEPLASVFLIGSATAWCTRWVVGQEPTVVSIRMSCSTGWGCNGGGNADISPATRKASIDPWVKQSCQTGPRTFRPPWDHPLQAGIRRRGNPISWDVRLCQPSTFRTAAALARAKSRSVDSGGSPGVGAEEGYTPARCEQAKARWTESAMVAPLELAVREGRLRVSCALERENAYLST